MVSNRDSLMRKLSTISGLLLLSFLSVSALAQKKDSVQLAVAPSNANALPADFSGWHKSPAKGAPTSPTDLAILKEYGLDKIEASAYQRGDRTIQVKAYRFVDATGAYGAFTFYRTPSMAPEKFCDQGASAGNHVMFFCTNVFVDVALDKVTAMTPSDMRDLAAKIPRVQGNLAQLPKLPLHLSPQAQKYAKFVEGPAGLDSLNETVKSSLVDFSFSPEVVVGKEPTLDGDATVVLVQYPTEKIAQAQVGKMIEWARTQKPQPTAGAPAQPSADTVADHFATRRSGPLVGIVSGHISENTARKILEDINYDAEVTWNEAAPTLKDNPANLIVNIIYLCFIVVGFTAIIGLAFGGFRLLMKKYFPGKLIDRPEDVEFIKLNLRD